MSEIKLREADRVEIKVLMDNYTDWLMIESSDTVKRAVVPPGQTLLAEHGLSLLIKVYTDGEQHTMVMDAAVSAEALMHNVKALNVDLDEVEAVVLSHGHVDHFGGLLSLFQNLPKESSLFLHPDAFLKRRMNIKPMGICADLPQLDERELEDVGANVSLIKGASTCCSDLIASLGEIERMTDFEKGFPWAEANINGEWIVDPFHDDQGININVRDKGLIVIGGCSHAGIINTIEHARKISGINRVHAILGGFHLTGALFEPIIGATVGEVKKTEPDFVIPMHCTGWKAIAEFQKAMPEQFLLNTVGTTYVFGK